MKKIDLEECRSIALERGKVYGGFEANFTHYAKAMQAVKVVKTSKHFSNATKMSKNVVEMLRAVIALKACRINCTPDSEVESLKDSYRDFFNYLQFASIAKHYQIELDPSYFNANLQFPANMSGAAIADIINNEGLFANEGVYDV